MNELSLRISDQAVRDLDEIWLYIALDSPGIADGFVGQLYEACKKLTLQPELGRNRDELRPGIRSLIFRNYIIYYRIKGSAIEILRILNGLRDVDSLY